MRSIRFVFTAFVLVPCFLAHVTAVGQEESVSGFSLLKPLGSVKEYYSSNKDNRLLIRLYVWGGVGATGIYYVPDNSTLLDVIGYAGGLSGAIDESTISLTRTTPPRLTETTLRFKGEDIFKKADVRNTRLQNGDIIYMDMPAKTDVFGKTVGITASILGVVTSAIALYFLVRKDPK